ncbi:hypothetical protein [Paenibacillus sp. FSL R10-2771]|uniref:hypothetical protein n=1 Tax=Paenibacillus sp. FSL R10-2771 TaxID=2954693 RepID=UPI0030F751BA
MKLSLNALGSAVRTLFKEYNSEDKASVRSSSERIIDDYEEIIDMSRACEFIIYSTLLNLVKNEEMFDGQFELQHDLQVATQTIYKEFNSEDLKVLERKEIFLGTSEEGKSLQMV